MAKTLSKTGISTDGTITAAHVTQSIDALTGTQDYDITITGNTVVASLTASANVDFNGDLDVDGTTNLDVVDIDGAVDMASNLTIAGTISNVSTTHVTASSNISASGDLSITGESFFGSHITASGNISSSGTITANAFTGDLTGQAATVATIAGLAPNTATTQATQAAITTTANLTTVGALNAGSITSGFTSIDVGAGAITTTGIISTSTINASSQITASGNISSSGIITGEGLTISDDAFITDTLGIDGAITGSGQMNLKLNTILVANRSDADVTKTLIESTYPNGSLLQLVCNNANGLAGSRDLQLTLPAVAVSAGRNLTAVVKEGANSQCELKIVSTDSGVLQGLIVNEADGRNAITDRTNIVIGTSDTDRGDRFDLMCDGTYWYVYGFRLGAESDVSLS
jgi:hypothetical protein